MQRLLRKALLVRVTLTIVAGTCLLIVAIRVQQYALRFRAERLQHEIQSLEYARTTLEQAQVVFDRWSATYDDGSCEKRKCSAHITIGDFAYAHSAFFSDHQRLFRSYAILGGRPALVKARVSIHHGVVDGKSYGLYVEVFPAESAYFTTYGYSLIGETATVESTPSGHIASRHPSYQIGWPGGCETCIMIYAHFTPAAVPFDVQRLGGLEFSCLTRWVRPCKEKVDIMPAAWAEAQRDQ
jgi:hypothetical protein